MEQRKHPRLKGYDYSQGGAYFVTFCTKNRRCVLSRPTALVSRMVAAIKRFSNRDMEMDLWQPSFYDHIIRDETDYLTKWNYIETNPARWAEDEYYI